MITIKQNVTIKENLEVINEKIKTAAEKSFRTFEDIKLIGVTKTISIKKMQELADLSVIDFGENKVQELLSKYDFFEKKVNFHLIGHLQTNKVKYIIDKVSLIHSVDSEKLAIEINKRAEQRNIIMDILIEVNIGNEESKDGVKKDQTVELINNIKCLPNICIKGLMTVAPFVVDVEENRCLYKEMYDLFKSIKVIQGPNIDIKYLSMGMSNDFEIAIEEGSNMVRIGTSIFGSRVK